MTGTDYTCETLAFTWLSRHRIFLDKRIVRTIRRPRGVSDPVKSRDIGGCNAF